MALNGLPWSQASLKEITTHYLKEREYTHHALRDAVDQAEIFAYMLEEARVRSTAGKSGHATMGNNGLRATQPLP